MRESNPVLEGDRFRHSLLRPLATNVGTEISAFALIRLATDPLTVRDLGRMTYRSNDGFHAAPK